MDVCHPVLRKYMKGPGGPGGSGSPENRKKRQDDDQVKSRDFKNA